MEVQLPGVKVLFAMKFSIRITNTGTGLGASILRICF